MIWRIIASHLSTQDTNLEIKYKIHIFANKKTIRAMKYTIISAKDFNLKLKCTIHSTGKLGFTDATTKHMKFTNESYVQFAQDDENKNILYLIHVKIQDENAFKVIKAGNYYYVNTKAMFDSLEYDYVKSNIIFDMVEIKEENIEIYKLTKRQVLRKQKTT